jgi:hypothetical protein
VDAHLHFHKVLSPCHSMFSSLPFRTVYLTRISSIHSAIFGRAVKNEHIVLGVLAATGAITYGVMGGSKKQAPSGKTLAEKVKEAVPINAGSRCVVFASIGYAGTDLGALTNSEEEQLYVTSQSLYDIRPGCRQLTRMDSIKNYIAEAEKQDSGKH